MTVKSDWASADTFSAADENAHAAQTNANTADIAATTSGTALQYVKGNKTLGTLNQDAVPDGTTNKAYTATEKTKLAGIATAATANDTDANLKARANHTGTQTASTISDFATAADARVAAGITGKVTANGAVVAATKTKITYDAKGLVTAGTDATQDDIGDGTTNKQYSATDKTKLAGIASGATANSSDATLLARANHTGTQSADTLTDGTTNKAFLATERTKLTGIAAGATANSTDATLLARANHTGTQSADTLTDGTTNKAFLATERTKLAAITGTNTGDQTSVSGNAGTATALQTARNVNGVAFNGTADITIPIPSDFMLVQVGNTARAVGSGDFAVAHRVGRAFTATSVVYQFDTADASGSTTVELRRNGSQVASSSVAVTAANQADGTGTDAARTVTINQSFSVGDRINLQITAVGTTPGKGLRAWIVGTWN